jgi:hypothetical protein
MLGHVRGGCWWRDSRGWTFLPIACKFCCCATYSIRRSVWHGSAYKAEVCHWIPPCGKIAPINIQRHLLNVYGAQTVDVSTGRRWVVQFSTGDSDMRESTRSGWPCTAVSPSAQISGLRPGSCVRRWVSASVCWKRCWKHWNTAKFVPDGSHGCSHRNIKTIESKSVRACLTTMKLKKTVSWISSSSVMRCGVTTTSWNQNDRPWRGDMRIPHQRKRSRHSHQPVKWCALV